MKKDLIDDSLAKEIEAKANAMTTMYKGSVDTGTEEMTGDDIKTPILKIIQANTDLDPEVKKEGYFYRSDTNAVLKDIEVNLVYVTTQEKDNYTKTAVEKVKVYFGFYEGTPEPFQLFARGWSMASHRDFQSEVALIKRKYQVPMLALRVRLSAELQNGTIAESGKPYSTYKLKFTILRDANGVPAVQEDQARIDFLLEAYRRFKAMGVGQSEKDQIQNDPNAELEEPPPFD